jgi:hypothetical protein
MLVTVNDYGEKENIEQSFSGEEKGLSQEKGASSPRGNLAESTTTRSLDEESRHLFCISEGSHAKSHHQALRKLANTYISNEHFALDQPQRFDVALALM